MEVQRDGFLQAEVVDREDVRPQLVEHEEHFGRPATDALDVAQRLDERLVVERRPSGRVEPAFDEMRGEVANVARLAPREPDLAQRRGRQAHDARRVDRRERRIARVRRRPGDEAAPDRVGRLDRDLLADDRAAQRGERVAAPGHVDLRVARDEAADHRIGARQRLRCLLPVRGLAQASVGCRSRARRRHAQTVWQRHETRTVIQTTAASVKASSASPSARGLPSCAIQWKSSNM